MVVPFLTGPQSFPLPGVDPARGRRRWGPVPLENSLPKAVFGLRLVVVSLLSSMLKQLLYLVAAKKKQSRAQGK